MIKKSTLTLPARRAAGSCSSWRTRRRPRARRSASAPPASRPAAPKTKHHLLNNRGTAAIPLLCISYESVARWKIEFCESVSIMCYVRVSLIISMSVAAAHIYSLLRSTYLHAIYLAQNRDAELLGLGVGDEVLLVLLHLLLEARLQRQLNVAIVGCWKDNNV